VCRLGNCSGTTKERGLFHSCNTVYRVERGVFFTG
jgi:hypothetical protein